jgi:hypothetical protein
MVKHNALKALKYGNDEPFKAYIQREEAEFWDPNHRLGEKIEIVNMAGKQKGLKTTDAEPEFKILCADYQGGRDGDTPHFPIVARALFWEKETQRFRSEMLFEGRKETIEDLDALREELGIESRFVLIDSGYKAKTVYGWCYEYDYNALKGEDKPQDFYFHPVKDKDGKVIGKTPRIFSPMGEQDPFKGDHEGREGRAAVPFFLYSKQGVLDRLDQLKNSEGWLWEVPEDVSDTYRNHHKPWRYMQVETSKGPVWRWVKNPEKAPDDLFMCEAYCALFADILGLCIPLQTNTENEEGGAA